MPDEMRYGMPDELVAAVTSELRRPVSAVAGLDARVMARVRAVGPLRRPGAIGWLVRSRMVPVSPLAGLAAAAAIAALAVGLGRAGRPEAASPGELAVAAGADHRDAPVELVAAQIARFALPATPARTVAVVGDFNGWDATRTPLERVGDQWVAAVPLRAGRYEYGFVVDGARFVPDPLAPPPAPGDYGVGNSVVTVGTP